MPRPDISQRLALRWDRLTANDNVVENFAAVGVATVQTKLIGGHLTVCLDARYTSGGARHRYWKFQIPAGQVF